MLQSADKDQRLVVAWLPVPDADEPTQAACDVVLLVPRLERAWGIDIFNGTEQELVVDRKGDDTVLRSIVVKDYPTYLRISK